MELDEIQSGFQGILDYIALHLQRLPGSSIVLRYIKSSYQNDPVRSAIELFLFLFAVRYLLAPSYAQKDKGYVELTENVRYSTRSVCAQAYGGAGDRRAGGRLDS